MNTAFKETNLWLKAENSNQSVAQFIQTQAKDFAVSLYWLEPALQLNDGQSGRLTDFKSFGTTLSVDSEELKIQLAEAYLFSKDAVFHIVATSKNSCRWCQFQEVEKETEETKKVQKRSYSILTRRDFDRFFGENLDWSDKIKNKKLQVTEYWTEEGLLTWRLSEERNNGNG